MKCPECHTEVDEKLSFCPECGAPMPKTEKTKDKTSTSKSQKQEDKEPRLGKFMMIFITAGIVFLTIFGLMYCMNHKDDPDYFRTTIEPDTTLADKDMVVFDTTSIDTAEAKKAEKEEKKEAEKIFNSIRRKAEPVENKTEQETENEKTEGNEEANTESKPSAPATEPAVAPTPKVESIESE